MNQRISVEVIADTQTDLSDLAADENGDVTVMACSR